MKKIIPLLALCFAALLAYGCKKLSQDERQAFVMTTPDVGNLTFKKLSAQDVDGQYFLNARTDVSGDVIDNTWVVMNLSFDKGTRIGKRITLNSCTFGPYNTEDDYAKALSSGHIYLKNKTETNITLRFKDVCFKMDWGDYRLNGDLTFGIERYLY